MVEDTNFVEFVATNGDEMIIMSRNDFDHLRDAATMSDDVIAYDAAKQALADGDDEMLPADMVKRMLAGESPVKVWRDHRGIKQGEMAKQLGMLQPQLSKIEATADGLKSLQMAARIANILDVDVDDLVAEVA